jgi:hypothetical protein
VRKPLTYGFYRPSGTGSADGRIKLLYIKLRGLLE